MVALLGGMEAMEAMEVMGMARGQQIPAMVTVDTEATEAMAMGVMASLLDSIVAHLEGMAAHLEGMVALTVGM